MNAQPQRPEDDDFSPEVSDDDPRRWLSALADGDAEAAQRGCELWRSDPQARQSWHAYHLIGDVLRSEELAGPPAHDAAFLARMRERLAHEPVPLAPTAAVVRRPRWLVPVTAAASVAVVAGVLVATQLGGTPEGPALAGGAGTLPSGVMPVSTGATLAEQAAPAAQPTVRRGAVIRDPRLDEMLRAHQAARGGLQVQVPQPVGLREVEVVAPASTPR